MTSASEGLDLGTLLGDEPFVRNLARSLLRDESEVDDVVQQTWLAALRAERVSRSWLARVVRSRVSNSRRDRAAVSRRERAAARPEHLPSAADVLQRDELRRAVADAVASLPEAYRVVVLMRYGDDLPPRQIAAATGVNKATVATRLKRGLAMLRERLDARHEGDRRRWALALVPIAVPAAGRVGAGVATSGSLVGTLGLWSGLLTMKSLLFSVATVAFVALVLSISNGWWGFGADALPTEPTPPAVVVAPDETSNDVLADAAAVAAPAVRPSRVVVEEAASRSLAPSVAAALVGFSGRVERSNGTPAAGERVTLLGLDPAVGLGSAFDLRAASVATEAPWRRRAGPLLRSCTTADDGSFLLEGIPADAFYALHAGVGGAEWAWHQVTQRPAPGGTVDLGTVRLAAAGLVRGRVVDADGAPIVGAEVRAADLPDLLPLAPVDRLEVDGGAVLLAVPAVDVAALRSGVLDSNALSDYHDTLRSNMSQRVLGADPDSEYVLLESPTWLRDLHDAMPIARARSDADGQFELAGVAPGRTTLLVRAPGFASSRRANVRVVAGGQRDVGTLRLTRGAICAGRVLDAESGTPLPNARLRFASRPVLGLRGVLFAGQVCKLDAMGRFEKSGLPDRQELFVAVQPEVGAAWSVHGPMDPDDSEIEIRVASVQALTLRVLDDEGVPLEQDVLVRAWPGPPLGELSAAALVPECALTVGSAAQDSSARGVLTVRGLRAGSYTLEVRAAGFVPWRSVCVVPEARSGSASQPIEVVLESAVACRVAVRSDDGEPVHGADVFARPAEAPAWADSLLFGFGTIQPWSDPVQFCGTTDAGGHLDLAGLPAGTTMLCARHPGRGAVTVRSELPSTDGAAVVLTLARPGSIRGQVFDGGGRYAAAASWRVVATRKDGNDDVAPSAGARATLDPLGRFVLDGLEPGTWTVVAEPVDAAPTSLGALLGQIELGGGWTFFEPEVGVEVEVKAGEETEIAFDVDPERALPGQGSVLRARFTIGGRPAAGYRVFTMNDRLQSELLGTLDADGALETEPMTAEERILMLVPADEFRVVWQADTLFVAGVDTQVGCDLEIVVLTGQVRRPSGVVAAAHEVSVYGELASGRASRGHGTVRTDEDGRFRIEVATGVYSVNAHGVGGRAVVEGVKVESGRTNRVDLTLSSDGCFGGQVIVRPGQPKIRAIRCAPVGDSNGTTSVIFFDGDETFLFAKLAPGPYSITLMDAEGEWRHANPDRIEISTGGLTDQIVRVGSVKER